MLIKLISLVLFFHNRFKVYIIFEDPVSIETNNSDGNLIGEKKNK